MAVAVTPQMKQDVEAAGEARSVDKSTIIRWAVQDWMDTHANEQLEEDA